MARRPTRPSRPAKRPARATAPRPAAKKKAPARATPATRPAKPKPAPRGRTAKALAPAGRGQAKSKALATGKPVAGRTATRRPPVARPGPKAEKPSTRAARRTTAVAPPPAAPPARPATTPKAPAKRPVEAPAPAKTARTRRVPPPRPRPPVPSFLDLEPEEDDRVEGLVPGAVSSLDMDHHPREVRRTGVDPDAPRHRRAPDDAHLAAGDIDADLHAASQVGEETPGGDNPTPDQDVVDLIGRSLGVEYEDDEELEGGAEITKRDKKRWELDPASAEDWKERSKG